MKILRKIAEAIRKILTVIMQEFKRGFLNIRTAVVFVGILLLNYRVAEDYARDCGNVADAIVYTVGGMKLYPILSVPLAMWGIGYSFQEDLRYGHISNLATRFNCKLYLMIKMFCSTFIFTLINTAALLSVAGILKLSYPTMEGSNFYDAGSYVLLHRGNHMGFFVIVGVFNSLLFSVYLLISELLSMYTDNGFFIYFSPVAVFYMMINISYIIKIPAYLLPANVFYCGGTGVFENLHAGLIYAAVYILILIVLMNVIFVRKHRIGNYGKREE